MSAFQIVETKVATSESIAGAVKVKLAWENKASCLATEFDLLTPLLANRFLPPRPFSRRDGRFGSGSSPFMMPETLKISSPMRFRKAKAVGRWSTGYSSNRKRTLLCAAKYISRQGIISVASRVVLMQGSS
jgi:hypothetical protein